MDPSTTWPSPAKPLPDLDEPHDDLWWVRKKLQEEDVAVLPPSLLLRQEVEVLLARAGAAPTEHQVRQLVEQANAKIRRANRLGVSGPPHNLSPYDIEGAVARWRIAAAEGPAAERDGGVLAPSPPTAEPPATVRSRRSRRRR